MPRAPSGDGFVKNTLKAVGIRPKILRSSRLLALVSTADPKLVATAFGMTYDAVTPTSLIALIPSACRTCELKAAPRISSREHVCLFTFAVSRPPVRRSCAQEPTIRRGRAHCSGKVKGESMKDASVESARFEPTVFGAVRRYRIMVLAFALVAMVAAVGYTRYVGKTYRAKASVTVPVPQSLQGQNPAQYLDSQVLLLQSPAVAQRAASIADATLQSNILSARDFSASGGSLSITPPAGAAAGRLRGQHHRCDIHRLEPDGRPDWRQCPAPGL